MSAAIVGLVVGAVLGSAFGAVAAFGLAADETAKSKAFRELTSELAEYMSENAKLRGSLDKACDLIVEVLGTCPSDHLNISPRNNYCETTCEVGIEAKCWKRYFISGFEESE